MLKTWRDTQKFTRQEAVDHLNQRLQRRWSKVQYGRWEDGSEPVPAVVRLLTAPALRSGQPSALPVGQADAQARVIAFANQKGGVGKTTTTMNVAYALTLAGRRVLLLDLDQQCSATISIGINPIECDISRRSLYHAMIEGTPIADCIYPTGIEGLEIAANGQHMAQFEIKALGEIQREQILTQALEPVLARYDYILIDCPPAMSIATMNALFLADAVLVPSQTEGLSVTGIPLLLSHISAIAKKANPSLRVLGIIPTMFQARQSTHVFWLEQLVSSYPELRIFEPVPRATAYPTAVDMQQIAMAVSPGTKGIDTFCDVALAILETCP